MIDQNEGVANSDRSLRRVVARAFRPPVPVGPRVANLLRVLGLLAIGTAYQGSVPSASMTYIAKEFGNSTAQQSRALAVIRVDIVASLLMLRLADRFGRRRLLLITATTGPLLTSCCSLAPNLWVFTVLQVCARSMVTATALLITVIVVEEVPPELRTWSSAAMVVSAAVGSGLAFTAVAIGDSGLRAWRVLYMVPLVSLVAVAVARKRLPESQRFLDVRRLSRSSDESAGVVSNVRDFVSRVRLHRARLIVVSIFVALLAFENTPTRQLQNDFLRNQLDFSSKQVALFSVLTNVPGILGLLCGGLLGDRFGHRRLLAFTITGFLIGDAGLFLSDGSAVWAWSIFGAFFGAASIPVVAILSAELFPTGFRSTANGVTTAVSRIGGVLGLLVAGSLTEVWSQGSAIAFTTIALFFSLFLLPLIPETSGRDLESLNPEDA